MRRPRNKNSSWAGMRAVLSRSLKSAEIERDYSPEWLQFQWDLSVGGKIAAISRVEGVTGKTLRVVVDGREWLPALKALESEIIYDVNKRTGSAEIERIAFREGKAARPSPPEASPVFLKTGREQETSPANRELKEESFEMIKDEGLRKILASMSGKFRWLPALALCCLALPNCATVPAGSDAIVNLNNSFAVREVQKRNKEEGQSRYKDPRAYYHYLMALDAEKKNDFDEAAKQYALAVKYDPKTEDLRKILSGLYLRTGQFEEGVKFCKNSLELFPKSADIRVNLADMLSSLDRDEEAVEHYLKVVELDPTNSRATLLAGTVYEKLMRADQALEMYKKTILVETNNPLAYHYLGKALIRANDLEGARDNFKKAVSLRPNFLDAREYLAWTLEKLGAYNEAIEEYQVILKLNPEHLDIREYLARTYPQGTPPGPKSFSPPPGRDLEDSSVHMKIGTIYYEQSMYLKALDEFRLIVAKEETRNLRLVIARIYELLGRFDKAIAEMEILRREEKAPVDILLQIALLYSMNNQTAETIQTIKEAIQIEPKNDQLYHSLSLAQVSAGRHDEAIASLQRAVALNDKKDSYYFELGSLFEKTGDIDDAIKCMEKTLELNPMHSNAHNFLGYIYSIKGIHLNEALDHLQKALSVQPRNGYFLDSLAWIYFKKGEPEKALAELKKAVIYTSPDPVLYDHLGEIYFELKNYEEAGNAWKTSLSLTKKKKNDPTAELPEPKDLERKIDKVKNLLGKSL